jgi:aminoglycoside phosphotransferase (APT) family kinase protein
MVDRILDVAEIVNSVQRFASWWSPQALIHGDVKLDNILVTPILDNSSHEVMGRSTVVLIDWELAGLGLPVWDIASAISGIYIQGLMIGNENTINRAVATARPLLKAYRSIVGDQLKPSRYELEVALVTSLTQTALQLCAMASTEEQHRATAEFVLATTVEFAIQLQQRYQTMGGALTC